MIPVTKTSCEVRPWTRRLGTLLASAFVAMAISGGAWAQQANNTKGTGSQLSPGPRESESDLALENLSRVAASPAQIRAVLVMNPGLFVELKRWVAQDAAGHGQIVRDADLSDDAIFDRLESDVHFRSVATNLLQKYGYLVPDVNPQSAMGREQVLMIQERAKYLAQHQEEQLARSNAPPGGPQPAQNTSFCGPRLPDNCGGAQAAPPAGNEGQQVLPQNPPSMPSQPGGPGITSTREVRLTQVAQPDQDATDIFFPLSGTTARATNVSMNSASMNGGSDGKLMANAFSGVGSSGGDPLGANGFGGPFGAGAVMTSPDTVGSLGSGKGAQPNVTETDLVRRSPSGATLQPVELVRKANPYVDVPSLYDMYVQATPRPATPTRFGADIFQSGLRDKDVIPMDMPAGPDYILGPGDGLSINLWGSVSQRLIRTVDREGRVDLPEVGPLLVSGKSLAEVQEDAQRALRSQFREISVDVSLSRLRTVRVYEVGDLVNPGAYDVSALSTPLSALFEAGGPSPHGSVRVLKQYRGNQLVQTIDSYDLLLHGVRGNMARLESGDTILVPPVGPQVTVEGMVRRPAVYELRDEKSLADVLELAGGLLPVAALRHIEVERTVAHEKRSMLNLNIPDGGSTADIDSKLQSFEIQDGDRIRIFPIAPYNQDAIYVEGHVIRPGKYSYRDNMRVTDVIGSYKDLLPEPATQYAEIIRLNAPDFHPTVQSFNLGDALLHPENAPVLHPLDTVRVYSRFDFEDPPTVSVLGEVRAPGDYRTSGQIHLSDAVHLAGGLGLDAATTDAQVFRMLPDGKSEIFSVGLSQALAGDAVANILLQPRDRILIHRNASSVDPETVSIEGEVTNPGRYPLTSNLRVADLVRTAGGLMPSADSVTADLVRFEWSDQNKLLAKHESLDLAAVLKGTADANGILRNGDVLTIRQRPGWNDLGASIVLKGEVKHPGTYGIRPGERLSSVIERAGGFQPDAYPTGAVLERLEVREVESKQHDQMILRIRDSQGAIEAMPEGSPQAKQAKYVSLQQWQTALNEVSANPPSGRVVIHITGSVNRWKNTPADVELRSRDTLIIPKRPNIVMVTGQVYNPTAVLYHPGKSAKWYLGQSGGPTVLANKKAIFVVRADGSVLGGKSGMGLWSGESLSAALQPGDTVVVPDKAMGGGPQWQNLLLGAQVASSVASSIFIALHY